MADVRYIKLLDEPNNGTVIKQEGHKFFGYVDGEWKRRGLSVAFLIVCLLMVNFMGTVANAEGSAGTEYTVYDNLGFRDAVSMAQNGDTIVIMGEVNITNDISVGSENKHLIIKRQTGSSQLVVAYGVKFDITNVDFDGNGYRADFPFIKTSGYATFTNCTFHGCGDSEDMRSTGAWGGAINIQFCSVLFNDCSFFENYALHGGHVAVDNYSQATFNNCTLKNGRATNSSGAVGIVASGATCEINGGVITENSAMDFGGGIGNAGILTVTGTKLFNNTANNGGADVGTMISGSTTLTDTVEELNALFAEDKIAVTGWVNDYDSENGIYIPDVDTSQEAALLKLQYSVIPDTPAETEEPSTDPETPTGDDTQTDEPTTPSDQGNTGNTDNSTVTDSHNSTDSHNTTDSHDSTTSDSNNSTSIDSHNSTVTDSSTHTDTTTNTTTNTDNSVSAGDTVTNSINNTDNSKVTNTTDSSTTNNTTNNSTSTTTNNYYQKQKGSAPVQPASAEVRVVVVGDSAAPVTSPALVTAQPQQNMRIDAKGVNCKVEVIDGVYNISIESAQEEEPAAVPEQDVNWYQIIQIGLLAAIFICTLWGRKKE